VRTDPKSAGLTRKPMRVGLSVTLAEISGIPSSLPSAFMHRNLNYRIEHPEMAYSLVIQWKVYPGM
jgi:hypothetical protein